MNTDGGAPPIVRLDVVAADRAHQKAMLAQATEWLREAVVEATNAGMSEVEVARRAGVTRMTVRAWAGKSAPRGGTV